MRLTKSIISSLLLFTVPAMSCPQMVANTCQAVPERAEFTDSRAEITICPSYDEVMSFIDRIENEDLDEVCDPADMQRINLLIAQFAQEGILDGDSEEAAEMAQDIEELLYDDASPYASYAYSLGGKTEYVVMPAIYYGGAHALLCKSWFKKKCDQVKKFCKKHKKEIIIGAAVVVAIAIVVVTAGAASGAGAAVAGAAAAAADSPDNDHGSDAKADESKPSPSTQSIIQERVNDFKEAISIAPPTGMSTASSSTEDHTFWDSMREMGSHLAHETLDGIATLTSFGPGVMQDAVNLSDKITPRIEGAPEIKLTPQKNFNDLVDAGHDAIDQVFSTDMAYQYTAQAAAEREALRDYLGLPETNIGIIPLVPGLIPKNTIPVPITGRVAPTQASSVKGWSVGQPITNLTADGNVPKWSTVRQRYWKNEAEMVKSNPTNTKYAGKVISSEENIKRMEQGLAPQKLNPKTGKMESMELHHNPAQRDGGLFDVIEVWPEEHAAIDPNRFLGE